jgi:hypothetical protein
MGKQRAVIEVFATENIENSVKIEGTFVLPCSTLFCNTIPGLARALKRLQRFTDLFSLF